MVDALIRIGLALLALVVVSVTISYIIDEYNIRKKVREEYKNAAKAVIESKGIKEVKLGIYDSDSIKIKEMKISSNKGVSDDLKVGQTIYL